MRRFSGYSCESGTGLLSGVFGVMMFMAVLGILSQICLFLVLRVRVLGALDQAVRIAASSSASSSGRSLNLGNASLMSSLDLTGIGSSVHWTLNAGELSVSMNYANRFANNPLGRALDLTEIMTSATAPLESPTP